MTFAHPLLLALGTAAIALPILIHILMRRRRRPAPWAAMRFLLEAYRKQRQRVRFEQWLLLLARCLIVALAAVAIARPMLPGGDPLLGSRATTLYLVVDNSLTATHNADAALNRHKDAAFDLLQRLDPVRGDRAALISLAGPAAGVVSPASTLLQSVSSALDTITPADSPADLHSALTRIAADISQDTPAGSRSVVVILSEFRAGAAPIDRPLPSLGESPDIAIAAAPPATDPLDNIAIAAVEPLRPIVLGDTDASTTQVRIRAVRSGPSVAQRAEAAVTLAINNLTVARGTLIFEPGAREASTALGIDGAALGDLRRDGPGSVVITAALSAPEQLIRDDIRRALIDRRQSLQVGLIAPRRFGPRPAVSEYRAADWASTALDPEALRDGSELRISPLDPATVDAAALSGLEAVVIAEPQGITVDGWNALRRFADLGGLIVLFPQPGEGAQLWTDLAINALDVPWELPREAAILAPQPEETATGPTEPAAAPAPTAPTLARPETPSPLLAMIDGELPDLLRPIQLQRLLPLTLRSAEAAPMLLTSDGRIVAAASSPGSRDRREDDADASAARGLVVYIGLALDLDWSDLPTKPLLLPLVQEVIRQGVSTARSGGIIHAGGIPLAAPGAVELAWAGAPGNDAAPRLIPLQPSGLARQAVRHAGVYRGLDAAGATRGLVIVNPAVAASDTDTRDQREIAAWLATAGAGQPLWLDDPDQAPATAGGEGPLSSTAASTDTRRDLPWLPAIFALALILAVIEAVAARWFSHASVAPAAAAPRGGAA